jgi:hypothetical protein
MFATQGWSSDIDILNAPKFINIEVSKKVHWNNPRVIYHDVDATKGRDRYRYR